MWYTLENIELLQLKMHKPNSVNGEVLHQTQKYFCEFWFSNQNIDIKENFPKKNSFEHSLPGSLNEIRIFGSFRFDIDRIDTVLLIKLMFYV